MDIVWIHNKRKGSSLDFIHPYVFLRSHHIGVRFCFLRPVDDGEDTVNTPPFLQFSSTPPA